MRAWLVLLAGCGTQWAESTDGGWRILETTLRSNASGNIRVEVRPDAGETAMLATFLPMEAERRSHLRYLQVGNYVPYRATDETAVTNPFNRSSAAFVTPVTSLNWPIQDTDGGLLPVKHKLTAGIVDTSSTYTAGTANVSVVFKTDPDPSGGVLHVNLVYGGDTGQDPAIVAATQAAVEVWRSTYRSVGIELELLEYTVEHGSLSAPSQGSAVEYSEIARTTRLGAVNIVLLENIVGFEGALGFAGNIPGPLTPSPVSAVAVDTTLSAGADGTFDDNDIRLMGETIAHEVGHYLGLYHPVEGSWSAWDNLDDTPDCTSSQECTATLGDNLMFPYPVGCSAQNGCDPQETLTPEQGAVANHYTGVL
ncbi:MAG: hypothetical protein KC656_09070 [Myxococcales bacterium]|nr:hypothetical protein [Myxococcales bacterium]